MIVLKLKEGWEGPIHDPYSYTELTVEKEDTKIKFHLGLNEYIQIENKNGEVIEFFDDMTYEELDKVFEEKSGFTVSTFRRTYGRLNFPSKCPECGSKKMRWQNGYPGEELRVCSKCGHITGYVFNESFII